MGRRTYESIGRPLPGRTTVIITRQKKYSATGCIVVTSLEEALQIANKDEEAFIFGGGEIFKEALPLTRRIYLTRIHTVIEGDTFFPELKTAEWVEIKSDFFSKNEKNEFDCTVSILDRK